MDKDYIMDKDILNMINARFDRIEKKIDSAIMFKWVVTGALVAVSSIFGSKLTSNLLGLLDK